jgi:ribokinase
MARRIAVVGLYGMSALFRLDHLPAVGETVDSRGLHFEGGGKGYNQALGALRQGADVFFATAVGEDAYGRQAPQVFQDDGLRRFACLGCAGTATAFAAVASDREGNNIVLVEQGACGQVKPDQIDQLEPELQACGILLVQNEMPVPAVRRCLELGKKHGLYTILNPAPAGGLDGEVLALADVVTPNLGEARALTGMPDAQAGQLCQALRDMGCTNVIITLGEVGAYVAPWGKAGYVQPAFPVECVDSTGAGDNFNGALAACLARDMSLAEAVRFAAASSALSVTRRGVLQAIPTRTQVEEFLHRAG